MMAITDGTFPSGGGEIDTFDAPTPPVLLAQPGPFWVERATALLRGRGLVVGVPARAELSSSLTSTYPENELQVQISLHVGSAARSATVADGRVRYIIQTVAL